MAQFTGLSLSGNSSDEVADALVALNRSIEYQMSGNLDSGNIQEIGGWLVGDTELQSTDFSVGMSSVGSVRFWAGGAKDTAPFRVNSDGSIVITNGSISWGPAGVTPPAYTAADVGALASDSPMLTYISPTGIYTGTLEANRINVGTLTGFKIQSGTFGNRVVMDSTGFHSYDSADVQRIAILNSDITDTPNNTLNFYNENGVKLANVNAAGTTFKVYSNQNLLIGGASGVIVTSNTAFFDFANVPIRNFTAVAKFG